jgi:hypothetical protein
VTRNPRTPAEWQEAVDGAEACLLLDSARQYGLIEGGPGVNVDRCVGILEHGRARGIVPTTEGVERMIAAFVGRA